MRRVTDALAIDATDTVTVLLVDADGQLRWRTTGPVTEHSGFELRAAITADASRDADAAESLSIEQFEFAFHSRPRPVLALIGVTPGTAHVTLTAEQLMARFGPWTCETAIDNVRDVCRTGPYHWYKAIGPRGSFVDRGLDLRLHDSRRCLRVVAPTRTGPHSRRPPSPPRDHPHTRRTRTVRRVVAPTRRSRPLWPVGPASMSHHRRPRRTGDESPSSAPLANDLFPLLFAIATVVLCAIGWRNAGLQALLCIGAGVTAYGACYLVVHDGYVHARLGRLPGSSVAYVRWVATCHAEHHRTGRERYGSLLPCGSATAARARRVRRFSRLLAGRMRK